MLISLSHDSLASFRRTEFSVVFHPTPFAPLALRQFTQPIQINPSGGLSDVSLDHLKAFIGCRKAAHSDCGLASLFHLHP